MELENKILEHLKTNLDCLTDGQKQALTSELMDIIEANPLEPLVMPKIAEVIENKKQKIDESLQDYLSTALDMTKEREGQLKLIASCERAILTEVLADIKSNFTA